MRPPEKRLRFQLQLQHILDYLVNRHCTTAYEHFRLKRNYDQHFHFLRQVEVKIATEKCLQFLCVTIQLAMSTCVEMGNDNLPLRLLIWSQHRLRETSPISTPTAQPSIGTERLRMGINDDPAHWSSTFNTVHSKYCRFIYIF